MCSLARFWTYNLKLLDIPINFPAVSSLSNGDTITGLHGMKKLCIIAPSHLSSFIKFVFGNSYRSVDKKLNIDSPYLFRPSQFGHDEAGQVLLDMLRFFL